MNRILQCSNKICSQATLFYNNVKGKKGFCIRNDHSPQEHHPKYFYPASTEAKSTTQQTTDELHDLFVPAENRSFSGKRVKLQEFKSASSPCFDHSFKAANSCYGSCLLWSISSKERRPFWSLEMEPALCWVDFCQKRKISFCESSVCPLWD